MQKRRLRLFVSRSVRATSSRTTCWYTTTCFRHLPPRLYRMQRRQNPSCSMESFLFRQLVRQAAFRESIPLGARKTPGYQAGVHKRCLNCRPGATLCKTTKIRIIRYIKTYSGYFSIGWIFVILPQHRHEHAVVGLDYKSFRSFYWINPIEIQNLISIQVCSCNSKS